MRVKPWHPKVMLLAVLLTASILLVHAGLDAEWPRPDAPAGDRIVRQLLLGAMIFLGSLLVFWWTLSRRPRETAGLARRDGTATGVQQILLAPANSVMLAGVGLLLAGEPGFGIHPVEPADGAALVCAIRRYRADAIIVDKEALLTEAGGLYSLLAAFPGLRVVVLNPEQNTLQVYERAQVAVEAVDDLLAVLRRVEPAGVAGEQ